MKTILRVPAHVLATVVEGDAVLLNTRTNQYYALKQTGSEIWAQIKEGKSLGEIHAAMLARYEVDPSRLEQDILEMVNEMIERQLVEPA